MNTRTSDPVEQAKRWVAVPGHLHINAGDVRMVEGLLAEIDRLRSFHDHVVAISSNERADHHSIGWAIVSFVDEEVR